MPIITIVFREMGTFSSQTGNEERDICASIS